MASGDFKDLRRRTASDKELYDKAFNTTNNSRHHGYQKGLASMVYKFLDKKSSVSAAKGQVVPDQQLAEELQTPIIRKIEKWKVYSSFNFIWYRDFWASKTRGGGGLAHTILTFVLEQQRYSNLVSIFTNLSRVHKIIQNYESTQVSLLMTS